ncbi:MAG: hypothetical protein HOV80_09075 [Polyangiaceae bacterium]|nr:hypothetical protein [Polyangiaceae bacterium]
MSEEEDQAGPSFATLTRQEAEWSWPPPAAQPVDPTEVPEVEAFFWRVSTTTKIAAYVFGVLLVTLVGVATARARDQYFTIGVEASPASP